MDGCEFVSGGDNRKYFYCEQDVLNYLFSEKYIKLPRKFNCIVELYLEYFLKTPWATAEMFGNIDEAVKRTFSEFNDTSKETLLH